MEQVDIFHNLHIMICFSLDHILSNTTYTSTCAGNNVMHSLINDVCTSNKLMCQEWEGWGGSANTYMDNGTIDVTRVIAGLYFYIVDMVYLFQHIKMQ